MSFLVDVKKIKKELNDDGKLEEFRSSNVLIDYLKKNTIIVKGLKNKDLLSENGDDLYSLLLANAKKLLKKDKIHSWDDIENYQEWSGVKKYLMDYGLKAELFVEEASPAVPEDDLNKVTIRDAWEICRIEFNYQGSENSFKNYITRTYGSFADFCIDKGYSINTFKWDSNETAIRCAEKLGSLSEIEKQSKSLFEFLEKNDLFKKLSFYKTSKAA